MEEHEQPDDGHAAVEGHGGHHPINPMDFADPANFKAALWALGVFILLVFVLRKFAWGPIVSGLNAREQRITDSLEKAEAIEVATRELAETNKQMLGEAQREAQGIIASARTSAQTAAAEITEKAQSEIEATRDRAKRELALEADKARSALRADAVELTIDAASKLLGRSLSDDDHRRLAEEALADAARVARN